MVKSLFFAKAHPLYRKLYLFLDFDLAQMPQPMYEQYKSMIGLKVESKGGSEVWLVLQICFHFSKVLKRVSNLKEKIHLKRK